MFRQPPLHPRSQGGRIMAWSTQYQRLKPTLFHAGRRVANTRSNRLQCLAPSRTRRLVAALVPPRSGHDWSLRSQAQLPSDLVRGWCRRNGQGLRQSCGLNPLILPGCGSPSQNQFLYHGVGEGRKRTMERENCGSPCSRLLGSD